MPWNEGILCRIQTMLLISRNCKNLFIIVWNLFTKYGIIIVYWDLKVEEKYILNRDY